jgi:hypothetical protein
MGPLHGDPIVFSFAGYVTLTLEEDGEEMFVSFRCTRKLSVTGWQGSPLSQWFMASSVQGMRKGLKDTQSKEEP